MSSYDDYIAGVEDGSIVSCRYVKDAVARFRRMREDDRFEFRDSEVQRVISVFSLLRHFQGSSNRKRFILEPWQQFIVAAIYGFFWKGTNQRVVTSVYIEMARKQGKTAFAAGLCLYHLIYDKEPAAEVYLAANSRDQAKIAYNFCKNFALGLDRKGKFLNVFRDNITFDATKSKLRVLAADATKLDGPNPSMYLLDEYHAARSTELKDVLQSGQGMRDNPMSVIITTAGFDKLSPCYEMRTMCTEVLSGVKTDDSLFTIIYTLDDGDDWKDENVWMKSNPNLGVTVKPKYIREQVQKAMNSASEEVGIKTKNINVWCDAENVWIPDHYIIDAVKPMRLQDFGGRECWVGVDLASTSDLTAMSFLIPDEDGSLNFITRYYLPESALTERRFSLTYSGWRRQGWLTVTPGNVTDYQYILNDLIEARSIMNVVKVSYDKWNSTQWAIDATDQGFMLEPYSQAIGNFNKPTKELERLIMSGKVHIDKNTITRHCFRNVSLAVDHNGNIKPSKEHSEKKIDGIIAMCMALGGYLESPHYGDFY